MDHDYYQVLGVDPSSDLDWIKTAYHHKASQCHPDRGGSHARMKLVNEAWEVVSNPELRRVYDESRAATAAPAEKPAPAPAPVAHPSPQQAPSRPSIDPHRWRMAWLLIARDFACADFPPGLRKWMGWSMGGDSISGWGFASVGMIIGVATVMKVLSMGPGWMDAHPFGTLVFMGGGIIIGGELAVKLHQKLAKGVFALAERL